MCLPGKLWRWSGQAAPEKHRGALAAALRRPDKGHIRIGGVDLRDMQTDTLMKQLSFVFQDNFLLPTR